MREAKAFVISKREVLEAYKRVKANQGAAGVDEQSIADFERKLKDNLYKIWNRMSSGSYFPPPVRTVKMVVKSRLEPENRPGVSSGFLGLQAREVGAGRRGASAAAMLAV